MIEMRFLCRAEEVVYETTKTFFGKEKKERSHTNIYRPILQYRETFTGGENPTKWISVPFILNDKEWIEAINQLDENLK